MLWLGVNEDAQICWLAAVWRGVECGCRGGKIMDVHVYSTLC